MLCERCKKNNATVFMQQIINGQKTEFHLCGECAAELNGSVTFDNMFKDFIDGFVNMNGLPASDVFSHKCPSCGFSFEDFRQFGKLGCADCYSSFRNQLVPLLKNIHGSSRHSGKFPEKAGGKLKIQHELENMKLSLKRAIENEEFEEAAKLRDKIREMEGGNKNE